MQFHSSLMGNGMSMEPAALQTGDSFSAFGQQTVNQSDTTNG